MIELWSPSQVRDWDRRAVDAGTPVAVLMDRAAGHLARAVLAAAGRTYGLRVALVCGKGDNGGDGLAAALLLARAGAAPVVALVGGTPGPAASERLMRWRAAGGRVAPDVGAALRSADLVVDCLLGTGTAGAPRGDVADAVTSIGAWRRTTGRSVVACDLPSGVDADTGAVPGMAVTADVTVVLGGHKRGLWLHPAAAHVGRIVLGELGLPRGADRPAAQVLASSDVAQLCPPFAVDAEKRTRGVVVVLAGAPGMAGAAVLTARGAMAAGAGLVTVVTSAAVRRELAAAVPTALTAELPEDADDEARWARLSAQLAAADALAVGPGLGHDPATVALVRRAVAEVDVPLVLDADGLNAFRHNGDALAEHTTRLLVLTPHARELGRLLGQSPDDVWPTRAALLPELSRRWKAVVVAKGPGSLVAAPDGRAWVNPTGSPALATGGTGDVLTGIVATLVAQRPVADAVAAAVWVHGAAGEVAGRRLGRSATAADVADCAADVWRRLSSGTDGGSADAAAP